MQLLGNVSNAQQSSQDKPLAEAWLMFVLVTFWKLETLIFVFHRFTCISDLQVKVLIFEFIVVMWWKEGMCMLGFATNPSEIL